MRSLDHTSRPKSASATTLRSALFNIDRAGAR
jgi:hypothetical protein